MSRYIIESKIFYSKILQITTANHNIKSEKDGEALKLTPDLTILIFSKGDSHPRLSPLLYFIFGFFSMRGFIQKDSFQDSAIPKPFRAVI